MSERRIRYIPPDEAILRALAQAVNDQFAQADAAYKHLDIVAGLGDFLVFVAKIAARKLNEGRYESLDTSNR